MMQSIEPPLSYLKKGSVKSSQTFYGMLPGMVRFSKYFSLNKFCREHYE